MYVEFLDAQGPDVLNTRVGTFMQYKTTPMGKVRDQIASAMPTRFVSMTDDGAKTQPVKMNIKHYIEKRRRISSSGSAR